jgi:hypothetical protein
MCLFGWPNSYSGVCLTGWNTYIDGAQLQRRVRHWAVQPAHHVHARVETGERAQVVLVDISWEVAIN